MKNCVNCGAEIYDAAVVCVHCGTEQPRAAAVSKVKTKKKSYKPFPAAAIIWIVLGIFGTVLTAPSFQLSRSTSFTLNFIVYLTAAVMLLLRKRNITAVVPALLFLAERLFFCIRYFILFFRNSQDDTRSGIPLYLFIIIISWIFVSYLGLVSAGVIRSFSDKPSKLLKVWWLPAVLTGLASFGDYYDYLNQGGIHYLSFLIIFLESAGCFLYLLYLCKLGETSPHADAKNTTFPNVPPTDDTV
ncbi:MAG: zinc ribbon domain-containing protein [Clostridia bacterium]|nr:zinc ribbon domain-containing protein [Clostridia bacterium]